MIPKQVEEQAALAEEVHKGLFAPKEEEGNEQIEEEVQEEETQEEEDVVDQEEEKFATKYNTLKGKYDAEVPRLHSELKELKQMIFDKLGQQTTPKEEIKEVNPYEDKLAKYREEYGDELVEMNRMLAKMEAEAILKERMQPITDQVASVEETQVKAAQKNFTDYLDTKVEGDWKALWAGKDEKFVSFLDSVEPNSGFKYSDIVKHHNDNWNADGLAHVFNAYLGSAPVTSVPEKVVKQPNPAKEALVAPSRTTTHTTPKTEEARIWTRETMAEFQKEDRMGKYTPEESKALWEDLMSAPSQNRMRN